MYRDPITTVVTAAASYDLTDLATVKDELQVTTKESDAFLSRGLTQASVLMANYSNRVFPVETVKDVFFRNGMHGGGLWRERRTRDHSRLQLSRFPITDIAKVTEIDATGAIVTLAEGTDFIRDAAIGQLVRMDPTSGMPWRWLAQTVTAQYAAGYEPIPADLAEACLRLVTARYSARGRDPALRAEDVTGVVRRDFWVGTLGDDGALPPEVKGVLDNGYRVPKA